MPTIPSLDLYRELEVDPAATTETIDAAWKSLLKRHHPDVAAEAVGALERVKRLNLAHEWLGDPAKRELYDRSRRRPHVVILRATDPVERYRQRGRTPTTVSPRPASAAAGRHASIGDAAATRSDPAPASAAHAAATASAPQEQHGSNGNGTGGGARPVSGTGPTDGARPTPLSAQADVPRQNPYAEYGQPDRAFVTLARGAAAAVRRAPGSRIPALLVPIALVSVLVVLAVSSFLGALRPQPPDTSAVLAATRVPSPTVAAARSAPAGALALASGVANSRTLPPPDLAADLPAGCRAADVSRAFSFEAQVSRVPARIFVVRCDDTRSFGPLVYVTTPAGWQLKAKGQMQDGYAYEAFSGSISGDSADEFGIAWTSGAGTSSTVTLYRVDNGVEKFWDSSVANMAWSLARFTYQGKTDVTAPGFLVVVTADLTTGTPNCTTCKDHQLYREFYTWETAAATPGLVRTARQPFGFGLP